MKFEITSCVLSAHNVVKLNVNNKRTSITQMNWEINEHSVKWGTGYWKKSQKIDHWMKLKTHYIRSLKKTMKVVQIEFRPANPQA